MPTIVTSRPSRIQTVPSPISTIQCQRAHGSRSSRAGIFVSMMRPSVMDSVTCRSPSWIATAACSLSGRRGETRASGRASDRGPRARCPAASFARAPHEARHPGHGDLRLEVPSAEPWRPSAGCRGAARRRDLPRRDLGRAVPARVDVGAGARLVRRGDLRARARQPDPRQAVGAVALEAERQRGVEDDVARRAELGQRSAASPSRPCAPPSGSVCWLPCVAVSSLRGCTSAPATDAVFARSSSRSASARENLRIGRERLVVEQRDRAVAAAARVVLPREAGRGAGA